MIRKKKKRRVMWNGYKPSILRLITDRAFSTFPRLEPPAGEESLFLAFGGSVLASYHNLGLFGVSTLPLS